VITHAAVGLATAALLRPPRASTRLFALAALLPVVPDLDTWIFGAHTGSDFAHRGATHSFAFAAALAGAVSALSLRASPAGGPSRVLVGWGILFLATALHGLLDAFTDGGSGVMLLWPFDERRVFWPTRPIAVAPLSVSGFFTTRGARVFASELLWVWLPAGALVAAGELARRRRAGAPPRA
jgi:inner membrane protein